MQAKRKLIRKKTVTKKQKIVVPPARPSKVQKPKGIDQSLHIFLSIIWAFVRYGFVFALGAVLMLMIVIVFGTILYARVVSSYSGANLRETTKTIVDSRFHAPVQTDGRKNILVLGTDVLGNRDSDTIRTDTLMVASISVDSGKITLISLPRDLWIASQSAKINSIYQQDLQAKSLPTGQAGSQLSAIVGDITSLTIHHTVVIDIATVAKIVDAFGGIDINVERSFVDYQFPRSDVDVRVVRDPKKLYEVVAFTSGIEHMSGDRVLKYIRSRHSNDPIEGSDDARVKRQQLVIATLLSKVKDPTLVRQPEVLGKLYKIYRDEFEKALSMEEIGSVAWQLMIHHRSPEIQSYQLPIEGVSEHPVLTHPERFPGGAWVYVPIKSDWSDVHAVISTWNQE